MLSAIEKSLEPLFKGLPPLSKNIKDWFVKCLPVLALVLGLLQLIGAWLLWQEGHNFVNTLNAYVTSYDRLYGIVPNYHLSFFYWLAQIVVVVDAVILLFAYSKLVRRLKSGWNLLFAAALVNIFYGLFRALDGGGDSVVKFLFSLVVSAITLYVLYQILPAYSRSTADPPKS